MQQGWRGQVEFTFTKGSEAKRIEYILGLGPGISFYRKSKINIKRKPNYEIGWFIIDQWSFHIDSMHFTLQTMICSYNYKSNDVFYL